MDKLTPSWGTFGNSKAPTSSSSEPSSQSAKYGRKKKRPAPFSLRLSFDEKQKLIEDAGRQSISAYIKSRLFDPDAPVQQARRLKPVKDQKALAQLLGMLGSSRIARNLDELAEAAEVGALPGDEETHGLIKRAADDIRIMRRFLLAALGIRETDTNTHVCESCSSSFIRAAGNVSEQAPDEELSP